MSSIRDFIPDEWVSAGSAMADMHRNASQTAHSLIKNCISFAVPFALGSILAWKIEPIISGNFQSALITFLGILIGFVVTLMLFTGRVTGVDALSLESATRYKGKVIYLLWSQSTTLIAYVATSVIAIFWLILFSSAESASSLDLSIAQMRVKTALEYATLGGLTLSITRTMLLPYQIYELHRFSLDLLVIEKEKQNEEYVRKSQEEIPDLYD